jgi:hypothetical protein
MEVCRLLKWALVHTANDQLSCYLWSAHQMLTCPCLLKPMVQFANLKNVENGGAILG